jgi:hypothetical protein
MKGRNWTQRLVPPSAGAAMASTSRLMSHQWCHESRDMGVGLMEGLSQFFERVKHYSLPIRRMLSR